MLLKSMMQIRNKKLPALVDPTDLPDNLDEVES
jgi:hypothetical protein